MRLSVGGFLGSARGSQPPRRDAPRIAQQYRALSATQSGGHRCHRGARTADGRGTRRRARARRHRLLRAAGVRERVRCPHSGLRALAESRSTGLRSNRAQPRLVIYGRGPSSRRWKRWSRSSALLASVDILPFLGGRDLVLVARRASVVVVPSVWEEPGATIAVELFACGVPVIATATGAQGEIFSGQGLLVPEWRRRDAREMMARHFSSGPIYPHPTGHEPWALPNIKQSLLALLDRGQEARAAWTSDQQRWTGGQGE